MREYSRLHHQSSSATPWESCTQREHHRCTPPTTRRRTTRIDIKQWPATRNTRPKKRRATPRVREREARKKERQKQKKALTKQAAPAPKTPATNGGHKTYDASLLKRARNVGGPPYEAFLKYLPHDCTEQQVTRFFAGCGPLEKAPRILKDRATGRVIRGFVTFAEEQGLQNALQKDGHKLGGRNVSVTVATTHGTCQQEGTHTPAMASEVVDVLGARHSNGVFVDGTFGRGGHSREILKALGPSGRLHGFDVDEDAIQAGKELEKQDSRFTIHRAPFSQMLKHLEKGSIQGVLLDVGISSPQLDGGRGFRPEVEGPVDMRFDASEQSETALQYLVRASRQELAAALEAFGGERPAHARRIADAVALAKAEDPSLSKYDDVETSTVSLGGEGPPGVPADAPGEDDVSGVEGRGEPGIRGAAGRVGSGDGGLWLEWRRCRPDVEARRVCCCGRFSGYALVGREGFNATQV